MSGARVLAGGRGVRAVETLIFRAESESNFLELDLNLQTLISTPHPPPRATATTVSFEHRERRTRHWRICAWTIGHNTEGWVAGGRSLTRVRVGYTPSRCRDGGNNKTIESHNTKAPVLKLSALTVTHHSTLCTSPTPYLKEPRAFTTRVTESTSQDAQSCSSSKSSRRRFSCILHILAR